jgi:hypothetical protein
MKEHGIIVQSPQYSLFTLRALVFVVCGSFLAIWPVLLHGGRPFMFDGDSYVYLDQGDRILRTILKVLDNLFSPAVNSTATTSEAGSVLKQATKDADAIRSISYAAFVGVLAPFGHLVVTWIQACLVMVFVYAVSLPVLPTLTTRGLWAATVVMVTMTSLPLMSSLLMADVFGAIVVLYAVLLVWTIDQFTMSSQITLSAVALFAITTHYGNLPFAGLLVLAAILLRAYRGGRLVRSIVMSVAVIATVLTGNIAVGMIGFDEVSVTPRRFPILLARSIEDGPAFWHLKANCAQAEYAVCELWGDDIPTNVGDALWGPRGMENAPSDLYEQIRSEEITILWRSFKEHPLTQIGSLTKNAVIQLTRFDASYASVRDVETNDAGRSFGVKTEFQPLRPYRDAISTVQTITFAIALIGLLAIFVINPKNSPQRHIVLIVFLGLLSNAAIFGGLSAPADRYQARLTWLVPFLAMLLFLERKIPRHG